MASYVILMNFTDQGARTASESPKRAAAFKEGAAKLGVIPKDHPIIADLPPQEHDE